MFGTGMFGITTQLDFSFSKLKILTFTWDPLTEHCVCSQLGYPRDGRTPDPFHLFYSLHPSNFFHPIFLCIMDDPNINGIKHSYVHLFKNLSCQFVKHFPKLLYILYSSNQSVPTLLVQKIDKQWFEFKHTKHICTSRFWE